MAGRNLFVAAGRCAKEFWESLDDWLLYLEILIQQTGFQKKKVRQITEKAKIFSEDIENIEDLQKLPLHQLNVLANQEISELKLFSLLQGAVQCSGNRLMLGLDLPAMTVLNVRAVQTVAAAYGFDVRKPFETVVALKVFHCATVPKRFQKQYWEDLKAFAEKQEEIDVRKPITGLPWMNHLLVQLFKGFVVHMLRKKRYNGWPLLSMAIGGWANFRVTKDVTDLAKRFYQYRLSRGNE
ncbi:EcsC family protein [Caldibacillus debilis]|uniref:EcsC family protein n=1 Tax=Caldibacillus debilis TaxID=301148 RepID=UPI00160453F5|nr:EcsC family protein [Caldibacillus debilis]